MKEKTLVSLIVVFCVFSFLLGVVNAESRFPGVTLGDTYTYHTVASSNPANSTWATEYLSIVDSVDWVRYIVNNVDNSQVGMQVLEYYRNGTELINDVVIGFELEPIQLFNSGSPSWTLIPANLNIGDTAFILPNSLSATGVNQFCLVDQTAFRTYSSENRETIHVTALMRDSAGSNLSYELWYDKKTGFMVESKVEDYNKDNPNEKITSVSSLVESNNWAVPEFTGNIYVPVLMVTAGTGVLLLKGKRTLKEKKSP